MLFFQLKIHFSKSKISNFPLAPPTMVVPRETSLRSVVFACRFFLDQWVPLTCIWYFQTRLFMGSQTVGEITIITHHANNNCSTTIAIAISDGEIQIVGEITITITQCEQQYNCIYFLHTSYRSKLQIIFEMNV